jgi:membrane-bound lytic murein transglycosylase B
MHATWFGRRHGGRIRPMSRRRIPYVAAVAAAAFALAAAGCGSSSSNDTTSAETWANGVCSAFSTWETSMKGLQTTVTAGGLSKDSLDTAASDAKDATQTLAKSLKKLGKPDTQAGQQAQDDMNQLSDQLNTSAKTIDDATKNASGAAGVLTAISTISATLVTMGKNVSTAVTSLQKLDPKGELESAFKSASSCKTLTGS